MKKIMSIISWLVILAIAVAYPASKVGEIAETGKTLVEILASLGLSFVFSIIINNLIGDKGIEAGLEDEQFNASKNRYGQKIDQEITPVMDKVERGCELINEIDLKKKQTIILTKVGLTYAKFINHEYDNLLDKIDKTTPKKKAKTIKKQWKAIKQAMKTKSIGINSVTLLSDCDSDINAEELSESIAKHKAKRISKSTATSIVSAIIFGYFTIKLVENPSWIAVVWGAIEVLIWLLKSMSTYYTEKNYIKVTRTNNLIMKMNYMDMILKFIANQPNYFIVDTQTFPREDENIKDKQSITRLLRESTEGGDIHGQYR
jgi:hypothetical protein